MYTCFFLNWEIQLCRYGSVRKDAWSGLVRWIFLAAAGFHHVCIVPCVFGLCKCCVCPFPFAGYFSSLLPCVAPTAAAEGEWEQSKQPGSPLAAFASYSTLRLLVLLVVLCMPEDMQCVCTYAIKFATHL